MPAELNGLTDHGFKPTSTSICSLSHQEDELAKGIQKKVSSKNLTEKKPAVTRKKLKTCICAPTRHKGSFRCHLHRASIEAQNKSKVNGKNVLVADDKQPKPSRFGRGASPRAYCHDGGHNACSGGGSYLFDSFNSCK